MVANKVLALLHRQLLPLPKGVNVGVVKNICASNETTRKLNCDDGSHGKARSPISVLPSALSSLFLEEVSFIPQLPPKKRLPATFSLLLAASSDKHVSLGKDRETKGIFSLHHASSFFQIFSGLLYLSLDYIMTLHWKA